MSIIDIVIIVFLAYGGWLGFKNGFVISLFTFLALFVGLYAGMHFSDYAVHLLQDETSLQDGYLPTVAFTLTFLAVGAMVYFGGKAIEKVIRIVQLSLLNKLAGLVLGLAKFTFFLGALIMIIESFDDRSNIISEETRSESLLYNPIKKIVTSSIPIFESSTSFLKESFHEKLNLPFNNEEDSE